MKKPRVYLDNCCFNRPYDNQEQITIRLESEAKLEIQAQVKMGLISLVWSFMLDFENAQNIDPEKKNKIFEWARYAELYFLGTEQTSVLANALAVHGIKNKDAVHLACAIESQCDYFLTTDKGIIKKKEFIKDLKVMNPVEYFLEAGETDEK